VYGCEIRSPAQYTFTTGEERSFFLKKCSQNRLMLSECAGLSCLLFGGRNDDVWFDLWNAGRVE
jgi:hypothetical protein